MNYQALAAEFWERGYLVIENMFESGLMDRYQELILQHFLKFPAQIQTL